MSKCRFRDSGTSSRHHKRDNTDRVGSRNSDSRFGEDRHRRHASDESSMKDPKRVLKVPRTNASRRKIVRNGKMCTGSRRTLKDVFNESYFELYEDPVREDEPLSDSDVRLINRDIRTILYDVKKFQSGTLTFTLLRHKCPIVLVNLRRDIEKKWEIMQMCIGQWGADWAIQYVLQRDRKYETMRVGDESSEKTAKGKKKKERVSVSDSEDGMPRKKGNTRRQEHLIAPRRRNHDKRNSSYDAYSDEDPYKFEPHARRHLLPSHEEENIDLDLPDDVGECSDAPDADELGTDPYSMSRYHDHDKGKSKARNTTRHVPHDGQDSESDVARNISRRKKRKVTEGAEHDFMVQHISPVSKRPREDGSFGERKGKNRSFRRHQFRPTHPTKKKHTYGKNNRHNRTPVMSFDDVGNSSGDDNEREADDGRESEYSGSDTDEDDSAVDEISSPVPRRKKN